MLSLGTLVSEEPCSKASSILGSSCSGCVFPLYKVSGQASLISMIFSCLSYCHINHFFRLYQKDKSSDSKVKFRQASNHCKRVLETTKFAYTNKESITWLSGLLTNLYLIYSTCQRCCLLHLKKNC